MCTAGRNIFVSEKNILGSDGTHRSRQQIGDRQVRRGPDARKAGLKASIIRGADDIAKQWKLKSLPRSQRR